METKKKNAWNEENCSAENNRKEQQYKGSRQYRTAFQINVLLLVLANPRKKERW